MPNQLPAQQHVACSLALLLDKKIPPADALETCAFTGNQAETKSFTEYVQFPFQVKITSLCWLVCIFSRRMLFRESCYVARAGFSSSPRGAVFSLLLSETHYVLVIACFSLPPKRVSESKVKNSTSARKTPLNPSLVRPGTSRRKCATLGVKSLH